MALHHLITKVSTNHLERVRFRISHPQIEMPCLRIGVGGGFYKNVAGFRLESGTQHYQRGKIAVTRCHDEVRPGYGNPVGHVGRQGNNNKFVASAITPVTEEGKSGISEYVSEEEDVCTAAAPRHKNTRPKRKVKYRTGFVPKKITKMIAMQVKEGLLRPYGVEDHLSDDSSIWSNAAHSHDELVAEHEKWMARHNRVYKDEAEKAMRLEIFKEAFEFFHRLNKDTGLNLAVGLMADLTPVEAFTWGPHWTLP